MHAYTTGQWVLLFFFYSFCGWVWECCYVSVRERRWVNRGFLQGPILPIYGSGAIIILLATIPVAENLWLVYFCGAAAATLLEYVTGDVMERLFKVRYWDYSQQKCNLNGYICLSSSIAWGFFSILLIRAVHPPVAALLEDIPGFCVDPAALLLTAAFTADTVRSAQAALDLREVLYRLEEENEDLRRLAKRAEVAAAFAKDDLRRFRERTEVEALLLRRRIDGEIEERREARAARRLRRQERTEAAVRRRTEAKLEALGAIAEALEGCRKRLDERLDGEALETRRAELNEVLERVRVREAHLRTRTAAYYHRSLRILRNNPSASSRPFRKALEALRSLEEQNH